MHTLRLSWSCRPVLFAAAATALAVSGCGSSATPGAASSQRPAGAARAGSRYPEAVPDRAALPRHLRAAPWNPAPGLAWSHRLVLAGGFTDVVAAGDVLYLLRTLPHRAAPMQLLVRADLRTGAVRYARWLVPVSRPALVVTRSGVWLLGPAWLSRNLERVGPLTLYRFDPQTLRLISRRAVGPGGCCRPATLTGWAGGRLWLTAGPAARLIRPVPWKVLRTVRIRPGPVQSLSFTPDGRLVYLATSPATAGRSPQLQERAMPGWRLLHASTVPGDLNLGPISAAGHALWVEASGGHAGEIRLYAGGLSHVRLALGAAEQARGREEQHFSSFQNSVRVAVLGGVTWLTATNALACLQPDTGQVLAEQPGDQARGAIITADPAAARRDIYGLGPGGLVQLQPPAACKP